LAGEGEEEEVEVVDMGEMFFVVDPLPMQ